MRSHRTPLLFWDVDTQVDFMEADGKLYVPGAEQIIPNLARLTEASRRFGIPIVASADDHEPGDPELSEAPDFRDTYPPHCLRGTPGARRIPETERHWTLEVGHAPLSPVQLAAGLAGGRPAVLVHKKRFDVFSNPNTEALLAALDPERIAVYGVALDVCDKAAIEGMLARGHQGIALIQDATRAIRPESAAALLSEWIRRGVEITTTATLLERLAAGAA